MALEHVLLKLDPLLERGNYIEAIQLLEVELPRTENLEDLCKVARKLAHLYRYGTGQEGVQKSVEYALVAGMGYIRHGRMGPAVAMLKWLREVCPNQKTIEDYRVRIAETFCRPQMGQQKKSDDNLPPPTPYSEFKAKVSLESFDGGEIRRQFDQIDSQKIPLFSVLSREELDVLLDVSSVRDLAPGTVLFREGDMPGAFYVVASGELELTAKVGFQKTFREGEFFGEVALISGMRRTATIKTKAGAEVIEISKESLQEAFAIFPRLENKIFNFYEHRLFLNVAARSLFFPNLSEAELEEVLDFFTPIHIPGGRVLIEQGAHSERAYFVVKGFLEVYRNGFALSRLGAGQFVGEIGLVRQIPRTARVVALSDCHLLECDRESFEAFTKRFPKVRELVDNIIKVRSEANDAADEDTQEIDISDYLVVD